MTLALRSRALLLLLAGALSACTTPAVSLPFSESPAAVVDGHTITMKLYQARLQVSRHRDPFTGIPEAIPSPAPAERLEDFTIEQLVREEIVRRAAEIRGIKIGDSAVQARIESLRSKTGSSAFSAALSRNGFTPESFLSYQRALLTEVGLLRAMAADRARSAAAELKEGKSFLSVAARWSDDAGTLARGGEVGWLRPAELPEAPLAAAASLLAAGTSSDIISTNRGFIIATVLGRRADQVHLAVILVLAPAVDLLSAQATPVWFTKFVDDREAALRRDGKLSLKVGSHAG
jgi:parvulin-like peptidyl-prolyl isomerase